jgi:hypothetical protein
MSLREMNAVVAGELLAFPRGPRGSAQNMFRMTYALYRMNSLGKKPEIPRSASAARLNALRITRGYHPRFEPICN